MILARTFACFACSVAIDAQLVWRDESSLPRVQFASLVDVPSVGGILCGGYLGASQLNSRTIWTWSRGTWARQAFSGGPHPCDAMVTTFDERRNRLVVLCTSFTALQVSPRVWEFDGIAWQEIAGGVRPIVEGPPVIAFAAQAGVCVMYAPSNGASATWLWDGQIWRASPGLQPATRVGHAIAYDRGRHVVVLHGGYLANGETWEWSGTWRRVSAAGPDRGSHSMFYDQAISKMVVVGGEDLRGPQPSTWAFDGASWTQLYAGPAPGTLSGMAAYYDGTLRRGFAYGGFDAVARVTRGETWQWDGSSWSVVAQGVDVDVAREGATAWESGGSLMAFGGGRWTASQWYPARMSWRHDVGGWRNVTTTPEPSMRYLHKGVFDVGRARWVIFGGLAPNGAPLGDTWEWDGTRWGNVLGAGPAAQGDHAMAYDEERCVTVLVGVDGTWEFDRGLWSFRGLGPVPGRAAAAMAYDPNRREVLLFGGGVWPHALLGDTWSWNGSRWVLLRPSVSPSPRTYHELVTDPVRERVVLLGGYSGPNLYGDMEVWDWDGTDWRRRQTENVPQLRHRFAATYSRSTSSILLFGGGSPGDAVDDLHRLTLRHPGLFVEHFASCPTQYASTRLTGKRPWTGSPCTVQVSSPPGPTILAIGFSYTSFGGVVPLPLPLAAFGLPGCTLYTDIAALIPMATSSNGAEASVAIPDDPALTGRLFLCQAFSAAPGANPAGLVTTNVGVGVVGVR